MNRIEENRKTYEFGGPAGNLLLMLVLLVAEFAGDAALFTRMCQGGVKSAQELAGMGLNADLTVQNPVKFLAYNLPYKIAPMLLAVRMWRDNPFGRK